MISLNGKSVLITRAAHQADAWQAELEAAGARVIHIPLIEIIPPSDGYRAMDAALDGLDGYDGVVFTSQNAVRACFDRLGELPFPRHLLIAAVGDATARMIESRGVERVLVAEKSDSEGLLTLLRGTGVEGRRLLYPRARDGGDELVQGLRENGAVIDVVEAYATTLPHDVPRARLIRLVESSEIDLALFASPSAVQNFVAVVGDDLARTFAQGGRAVPMGPVTRARMKSYGWDVRGKYPVSGLLPSSR